MNLKTTLLGLLFVGLFLAGCTSSQNGYATYNQPQQQQYVGGGCGVSPSLSYEDTPINALDPSDTAL